MLAGPLVYDGTIPGGQVITSAAHLVGRAVGGGDLAVHCGGLQQQAAKLAQRLRARHAHRGCGSRVSQHLRK